MRPALRAIRIGRVLLRYRLDDLADGTPAERWLRLARPFVPGAPKDIAATAALQLTCRVDLPEAMPEIARLLETRDDARGKVLVSARDPLTDEDIRIELGRSFALGPDTVARLELVAGVTEVALSLVAPRDFRVR